MESGGWAWRPKASDTSWRMCAFRDLHVASENLGRGERREREKAGKGGGGGGGIEVKMKFTNMASIPWLYVNTIQ